LNQPGTQKNHPLTGGQLPWSTCNEDLIDLFSTIGKVDRAEIQYEHNGRSRGTGVVQFDTADTAETAIGMFDLD
jgi:RNA recognition motif-containing protein